MFTLPAVRKSHSGHNPEGWLPKGSLSTPHGIASFLGFMPPGSPKFIPLNDRKNYHRFEDVIGCKWSASIVVAVGQGIKRPGELERFIPGISTKILNERLRKLVAFGVLVRTEHPGLPARVDYDLTEAGMKLGALLNQVRELNLEHQPPNTP
jgi:DNA-binding HxlR family transcriptional regulator